MSIKRLILVLTFATSCSLGSDYRAPEVELPVSWKTEYSQGISEYWENFSDETLNKVVSEALQNNRTVKESLFAIEESMANKQIAWSEYFPSIELQADYNRRRRSSAVASAIQGLHNEFYATGGLLSWELDLLGRVRKTNEAAGALNDRQIEDYRGLLVTTQAETSLAYIRVRTLQAQVALAEKNIKIQKDSLQLVSERFEAGLSPELDLRQAESSLNQTKSVLPTIRTNLARQVSSLAVLLGVYPDEAWRLVGVPKSLPTLPNLDKQKLPYDILRQRPDVRAAERELAAEHALIAAREAELYPIISLTGSFRFEALNSFPNQYLKDSLAYSIGPSIRWSLFNFGESFGAVSAQRARMEQAVERYLQQILVAVKDVEDSIVYLSQEKKRANILKKSVTASYSAVELATSLYATGLTDFQNVLDAEQRLFEQELALEQSRGNQLEAYIGVHRALGGHWFTKKP